MPQNPPSESDAIRAAGGFESVSPPPHRATLTPTNVTAQQFSAFRVAQDRGFQEESTAEQLELERAVCDPARFFGHTVDGRWVSTFGSYARRLTVPGGRVVPVSAVTAVTVHSAYQGRGLLRQSMTEEFRRCRERGEPVAVLYASESGIYGRFGYGNAASEVSIHGRTQALRLRPDVAESLQAAGGSVDEVGRSAFVPLVRGVHEHVSAGQPGALDRPHSWWQIRLSDPVALRSGATALRHVVSYDAAGDVDGFAVYRVKSSWGDDGNTDASVQIRDLEALSPDGYARLWRYLSSLALVRTFSMGRTSVAHPLQYLVTDPRAIVTDRRDSLYARIIDTVAALSARRYAAPVDVVLEVRDDMVPSAAGRFALQAGPDGADVTRTDSEPDVTIAARELATIYLGGTPLADLQGAGLAREHRPGAVAAVSTAFGWPIAPYCADIF